MDFLKCLRPSAISSGIRLELSLRFRVVSAHLSKRKGLSVVEAAKDADDAIDVAGDAGVVAAGALEEGAGVADAETAGSGFRGWASAAARASEAHCGRSGAAVATSFKVSVRACKQTGMLTCVLEHRRCPPITCKQQPLVHRCYMP